MEPSIISNTDGKTVRIRDTAFVASLNEYGKSGKEPSTISNNANGKTVCIRDTALGLSGVHVSTEVTLGQVLLLELVDPLGLF